MMAGSWAHAHFAHSATPMEFASLACSTQRLRAGLSLCRRSARLGSGRVGLGLSGRGETS